MTAITNEALDAKVNELNAKIKAMEEQANAMEKEISPVTWKTKCIPTTASFKTLHVATKEQIVEFLTKIYSMSAPRAEVVKLLGIKDETIANKYDGHTFEEWTADCKLRLKLIEIQEIRKKVSVAKSRIEGLKSEIQKRADGIDELANILI